MANALVDFGPTDGVQFSLGAGAGRTWMDIDTSTQPSGAAFLDTDDSEWAWQGIAQVRVPVSDSVDLGLKYRYFSTLEFETEDVLGRNIDFEVRSHSAAVSLLVKLGRSAPPPPPAPAPIPTRVCAATTTAGRCSGRAVQHRSIYCILRV